MYNFSYVFNITGIYTASNPSASSTDTSLQIKMLGALKKKLASRNLCCWCLLLSFIECILQQRKRQKYPYMLNKLIIKKAYLTILKVY